MSNMHQDEFVGWFTAPIDEGGTRITGDTINTGNLTAIAQWSPRSIVISFNLNGGTADGAYTQTLLRVDEALGSNFPTEIPRRDGHRFLGWFTHLEGGDRVDWAYVFHKTTQLVALWEEQQRPTILVPANENDVLDANSRTIVWQAVENAVYRLTLRDLETYERLIDDIPVPGTSYVIPDDIVLVHGRRFRVAVSATTPGAIVSFAQREFRSGFNYHQMNRRELAQEILDRHNGTSSSGRHIYLRLFGSQTDAARTSTYMNLVDTANGLEATRAAHANDTPPTLIGGTVALSENLLRAILLANDRFGTLEINSLAGGRHSPTSRHYQGRAVDFQADSWLVRGTNPRVGYVAIMEYLHTHGFTTQPTTDYIGAATFFHLEIRN